METVIKCSFIISLIYLCASFLFVQCDCKPPKSPKLRSDDRFRNPNADLHPNPGSNSNTPNSNSNNPGSNSNTPNPNSNNPDPNSNNSNSNTPDPNFNNTNLNTPNPDPNSNSTNPNTHTSANPNNNNTILDPVIKEAKTAGYPFLSQKLEEIQLNKGADVNEKNFKKGKRTALHDAVEWGNINAIQALLNNNATYSLDTSYDAPLDILVDQIADQPNLSQEKIANQLSIAKLLLAQEGISTKEGTLSALLKTFLPSIEKNSLRFDGLLGLFESNYPPNKRITKLTKILIQFLNKEHYKDRELLKALAQIFEKFPAAKSEIASNLLACELVGEQYKKINKSILNLLFQESQKSAWSSHLVSLLARELQESLKKENNETVIDQLFLSLSEENKIKVLNRAFSTIEKDIQDWDPQTFTYLCQNASISQNDAIKSIGKQAMGLLGLKQKK